MLYIVKVFEDNDMFEYEYGTIDHALEQYEHEETADIIEYNKGNETLIKRKVNGVEKEV